MVDPGHTVRVEEAACHGELSLRLKSSMRKKNLIFKSLMLPVRSKDDVKGEMEENFKSSVSNS